jgi:polysaccharide export outer membrane protein
MRIAIGTLGLLLAVAGAQAQTAAQAAVLSAQQCGPAGCITGGTPQATHAGSVSPQVIRASSGADEEKAAAPAPAAANPPAAATPAPASNDFDQFVQNTLGHSLPVFGRGLFQGAAGSFSPSNSIPVPADYIIGTGDDILIRAWGKIDIDVHVTVDRNGQIFIPRVGTLTVAGLRMDQLSDFIHSAIAQQFKDFQLTVTLGQLRSIQIFVLGQASHPGVYTISSLSTLVNALFASGGPSATGTLRDIQVKRAGQVIVHFDVYRLLLKGDKSQDIHLLPGDIIYIPEVGPQVAIDGDVNTPAIFELKNESTVGSVLADAGGLTAVAGTARVMLQRIMEHSARTVAEFPLDPGGLARPLKDGDILRVFPISPKIEDAVTLRGNVASPGLYAWHAGMRVSDLIPNREFLLTRSYYNGQNALDIPSGGSPFGSSAENATPDVANHATEINWNYAVIERLNTQDLTTKLIPFVLGDAIGQPGSAENKDLEPGDVVVIYSRKDVALPQELEAKFVRIDGEVNAPGTYRIQDGETLQELVQQAGGLAPHSYLYAAQLTRESVRLEQVAKLQQLVEQESQQVLSPINTSVTKLSGSTSSDASAELELRRAYIARLNDIHPTGRIVLRLKPDANGVVDVPDFALEDGDHYFIPSVPNTVEVLGNVYNQGAQRFLTHQEFRQYLFAAGGPTREGDKKREFVIRADGTLVSRQQISGLDHLRIYPGDTLVVPPKLKGPNSFDLFGYAQLLSSLAIGALAVKALQ